MALVKEYEALMKLDKKREEIREGIKQYLWNPNITLDGFLFYLHSQGVVIKVDRELPLMVTDYGITRKADAIFICAEALREQGYVAVEPLIED